MSEHESHHDVAGMLALAAAGALDGQEQRRLQEHVRECPVCRRELEIWSGYSQGLRQLPQPPIPAQLMERTRTRLVQEHAAAADRRWDELQLIQETLYKVWSAFLVYFIWLHTAVYRVVSFLMRPRSSRFSGS